MMKSKTNQANNPVQVSIFHTNDMHGRLEDMARLSTFSRKLRDKANLKGIKTFFWDAGDAADRRIPFCGATKGAAFPQILNAMGYSLQAMGNAISVTYGPQFMTEVAARSEFPILAANFQDGNGPVVNGMKEYEIIQLNETLRMGVIGFTASAEQFYILFGLHIPDFREIARKLVAQLRSEGANIIVILSHLGLNDDQKLADEVDGIDLIIGGHSHSRLENGELRNGVLIAQTGALAKAIGRIDLTIDPQNGNILSRKAHILDVPEDTKMDPAVLEAIKNAEEEAKEIMAQPIGKLAGNFDHDYFRDCGIGNLAADALKERFDADVAIITGGLFHGPLQAGTLTLGQLDAACFTTANPWLSEIRGEQILAALERSLQPEIMKFEHGSLRGAPVGIPQISGMQVYYDSEAEQAPRLQKVLVNDQPIELDRLYRVAHTDAETMKEVGCLQIDHEQIIKQEVPTILREAMADYIQEHSPLPVPQGNRWVAIN
ncbi:MAG: bifunctional metallophosphatase/5'-nucleotidase [Anaerolineaceae bacterium]|nr:bifunctional metallophosphatase/5'-nucleotidase [Anaerolineaceae bacterium]